MRRKEQEDKLKWEEEKKQGIMTQKTMPIQVDEPKQRATVENNE